MLNKAEYIQQVYNTLAWFTRRMKEVILGEGNLVKPNWRYFKKEVLQGHLLKRTADLNRAIADQKLADQLYCVTDIAYLSMMIGDHVREEYKLATGANDVE